LALPALPDDADALPAALLLPKTFPAELDFPPFFFSYQSK